MEALKLTNYSNPIIAALELKFEDKIIFIQENSMADSNFLISFLLKHYLQENNRVCLLTLHNNLEHYQSVGRKLSYDLKKIVESGNVKILSPVEEIIENIQNDLKNEIGLVDIFLDLKNQLNTFLQSNNTKPVYILIDDLSHFFDVGIDLKDLIQFINYCINLTSDSNVFLIINSHVGSKSDTIIANSLQYVCDLFINVSALKTGRSTDITGSMSIQRGKNETKYHYKLFDRGIKTFHPGEIIHNLYK